MIVILERYRSLPLIHAFLIHKQSRRQMSAKSKQKIKKWTQTVWEKNESRNWRSDAKLVTGSYEARAKF